MKSIISEQKRDRREIRRKLRREHPHDMAFKRVRLASEKIGT